MVCNDDTNALTLTDYIKFVRIFKQFMLSCMLVEFSNGVTHATHNGFVLIM